MIISPSAKYNSYIWKVEDRKQEDISKIVSLCREYEKNNKILRLRIAGENPSLIYIQLINVLGRYNLFNLAPIFNLKRLTPKTISAITNKRFLAFYFKDIIGSSVLCPDRDTGKKTVELFKKLAPNQLYGFGSNDRMVATSYNGKLYKLTTNRKEWTGTQYPSFSLETKDGLLRVYLTDLKRQVTGRTLNIDTSKLNNTCCRYYSSRFMYTYKSQKMFNSMRNNIMYFLPYGQNTDIISLSDYKEYIRKYAYDDPSKGYGTRLFYYDEAEMIPSKLFPSGNSSFKLVTEISNDEIAIHKTPSAFIKKSVKDCEEYVSVLVRVPRLLVVERERLEQLITERVLVLQS